MERPDIVSRVKSVVSMVLEVPVESIQESHKFTTDLGAESVQSLELVAGFEEEFDIEMDEDEALTVQSVADAVDFIARYLE